MSCSFTHASASSIDLFKRCETRWYNKYLLGFRDKATDAMTRGSQVHEQLENYLTKGTPPDSTIAGVIASKGLELLPQGEDLEVEVSLSEYVIPNLPVPFKGFIDVLEMEEDAVHIVDHKTTSGWKWTKSEDELASNLQMVIYARHVLEHYPDIQQARLTHIYYLTRPPHGSKKVSVIVSRSDIYDQFDQILEIVKTMTDRSQKSLEHSAKNKADCYSYGKQCSHYNTCWHTVRRMDILPISPKQEQILDYLRGIEEEKEMSDKQQDALSYLRGEDTDAVDKEAHTFPEPNLYKIDNSGDVILYIGCKPLYGEVISLVDHVQPLVSEVCQEQAVDHISLIPYAEGWNKLSLKLQTQGLPAGSYYLPPVSALSKYCTDTLIVIADQVILAS